MTNNDTFYDIHLHAFTLSHPSFNAFLKRFKIRLFPLAAGAFLSLLLVIPALSPRLRSTVMRTVNRLLRRARNLLSVMESDIGSFFLIIENCLRERPGRLLKDSEMTVGGNSYRRIVLTPLMMDFGYKSRHNDPSLHYQPGEKPIVAQVADVFNAIRKYRATATTPDLAKKFSFLADGAERILEVYPFLGLNTENYDIPHLELMLEKYFHDYRRSRAELAASAGNFDGDIERLKGNSFTGIKVYPPLGFDPWPYNPELLSRVNYLYDYCCRKRLPITCHGSRGGFVAVSPGDLQDFTRISKWASVLAAYPSLKINIAHFPANGRRFFGLVPPAEQDRLQAIIALVLKYENVYADFAMRGASERYYRNLRFIIDSLPDKKHREKLTERILFGSDFAINLFSVDSYNRYIQIFSGTPYLTAEQKRLFCSVNPERFLFGETTP
ncbi:MAG: amidohydrolase family protein [Dehalococcoidales bacterium]|jgi:predicted TIM-barrel fold metal-dependent hydrolase